MRKIFRGGLGLALVVTLTGCIKMDIDTTVRQDGKVDGTMIVGFSDQMITMMASLGGGDKDNPVPRNKKEFIKQMTDEMKKEKLPRGVTAKPYDKGGFAGVQVDFKGQDAEKVLDLGSDVASSGSGDTGSSSTSKDRLTIKKVGDKFKLDGVMDFGGGTEGLDGGPDMATLTQGAQLRFKFTFPGKVLKASKGGKISGKSVEWKPKFGEKLVMTAEANAK